MTDPIDRTSNQPKYPDVKVQLTGGSGNGFVIAATVGMALKKAGLPPEVVDAYREEATSGDYQHLLAVTMQWVDVS